MGVAREMHPPSRGMREDAFHEQQMDLLISTANLITLNFVRLSFI